MTLAGRFRQRQAPRWTAALAALAAVVAIARPAAQVPSVWFGTWTVVKEQSTYTGPPAYKRATYTIEPAGDGLRVIYDAVLPRGGVTHLEWTGRLDGREQIVQGSDQFLTYAYRPTGDGSYELVARIDGRVAAIATVVFSPDGRRMTTTTRVAGGGGNAITTRTVYERKPLNPES